MNRIDECHVMKLTDRQTDRQTCDWKCDEIQKNIPEGDGEWQG